MKGNMTARELAHWTEKARTGELYNWARVNIVCLTNDPGGMCLRAMPEEHTETCRLMAYWRRLAQ